MHIYMYIHIYLKYNRHPIACIDHEEILLLQLVRRGVGRVGQDGPVGVEFQLWVAQCAGA